MIPRSSEDDFGGELGIIARMIPRKTSGSFPGELRMVPGKTFGMIPGKVWDNGSGDSWGSSG